MRSRTTSVRGRRRRFSAVLVTPLLVATVLVSGALSATIGASSATAHVSADSNVQPTQGGYGQVRLSVPSEEADAATVAVSVTFPDGVDLTSARTLPIPGWRASVDKQTVNGSERVARITWEAQSEQNGLGPTEFGQFTFSGGPWPTGEESVSLPTQQRYSNGSVVDWNEVAVDDQSEPDHPTPVVSLAAASDDGHNAHGGGNNTQQADSHDSSGSGNGWWAAVSVVGLVVGLAALVIAGLSLRRRPQSAQDASD